MTLICPPIPRDQNQKKILETIIQKGPISRASLSKELGLTKATISSQVQGLLDAGVVEEIGSLATSKGRHPILLQFRAGCGQALAFDLAPTAIRALRSNLLGQQCVLYQQDWDGSCDSLLPLLGRMIRQVLDCPPQADTPQKTSGSRTMPGAGNGFAASGPLTGISLGIYGVVHESRILFTPYYHLEGLPLKELLEQEFDLPVYLENEANLSALGERTFSFGSSSLVNINVHAGIGLGIIMNDRLYTGSGGFAGEFGHTIVEPGGLPCPCGNRGCIEQYASLDAVLWKYNQQKEGATVSRGGHPQTENLHSRHRFGLDELVADYRKQESAAVAAIDDFVAYMAIGLNNIVNIFNPQLIVLNSLITAYLPDVVPRIQERFQNAMSRECPIVSSTLQDTATLLGGIAVCARQYLGIEDFRPAR